MNDVSAAALAARTIGGLAVAMAIAAFAWRAHLLTRGGAIAATVIGGAATAAGWSWSMMLIVYFVTSASLTRWRHDLKASRTEGVVEKGGARDATQVLANGALFAAAALLAIVRPLSLARWLACGAGALAASAADTWATEVGVAAGGTPRSILTGRTLVPGTSGGISLVGSLAAVCGAACIALLAIGAGWSVRVGASALAGGVAGAFVDSLIGATFQEGRRCESCDCPTERRVHACGRPTQHVRGLLGLDNDAVNFVAGLAGGLLAAVLAG